MRSLLAERPGITLQAVGTAAEGLAQAGAADVVLLDLDLPDRPGLALLQALRADERLKRVPVIVVSAETRPERIDACFDAGATAFLSKPLAASQLLRALDEALQQP
jgi:two-component system chemotaxis response regulator CheY